MSNLRSTSLKSPHRANLSKVGAASVGLVIGTVVWVIGARFTIDGVIWVANWLLGFVRAPTRIPLPLAWQVYLALAPVPLLFSVVEWRNSPRQRRGDRVVWLPVSLIWVWIIVSAMDLTTTFLGLGTNQQPASDLARWFVTTTWAKGIATAFLTFWPEWLVKAMLGIIRRELT